MTATVSPAAVAPSPTTARERSAPAHRLRRVAWRPEWVVFAVALATRLTVILRQDGVSGMFGYDSGVYFAGADSLIHGRLPYADYVQLHPPGITVALAPFALLTHVLSDSSAFTVTIFAWTVLGAVNAVLVTRVGRGLGLGRAGATAAGLFYALWMGAVSAEYLIKLEPLGNALVLVALLLALRAQRSGASPWPSVLAGVPLGLAVSVKIWWIVPVVAIVGWHGARLHARRHAAAMAGGAVGSAVVLNLPFFLAAPRQMWSMVIVDQVGRKQAVRPRIRLQNLTGVSDLHVSPTVFHLVFALVGVLALLAAAGAWRNRVARPVVALAGVQLFVVLVAPSWFPFYCDYLAVAAALVVGAALSSRPGRLLVPARAVAVALIATVAAMTTTILASGAEHVAPFRGAPALARAVAPVRCVMTDSPAAQIRLNALSRGLAAGCPNWVDVSGPTYGPYRSNASRAHNPRWQRALLAYLRRGQAIILVRGPASGATAALQAELARAGRLATVDGHTVYRAP